MLPSGSFFYDKPAKNSLQPFKSILTAMSVQVMPPGRDLTMQIGDAIDDWHLILTGATSAWSISCPRTIG